MNAVPERVQPTPQMMYSSATHVIVLEIDYARLEHIKVRCIHRYIIKAFSIDLKDV